MTEVDPLFGPFYKLSVSLLVMTIEQKLKFFVIESVIFNLFYFIIGFFIFTIFIFALFNNHLIGIYFLFLFLEFNKFLSDIFFVIVDLDSNIPIYCNNFTDQKSSNKACTILSSSFSILVIILLFGWILGDHAVDFANGECIPVVFGDKLSIVERLFNFGFSKIVWCIFGILDELPNPP